MVDEIFADLSKYLDKNCGNIANKGREMACSEVANKIFTPTAASNFLAKIGIKVSVSTLHRDS